jgi:predicted metal-dependent TIM-barrel fold hydrolase
MSAFSPMISAALDAICASAEAMAARCTSSCVRAWSRLFWVPTARGGEFGLAVHVALGLGAEGPDPVALGGKVAAQGLRALEQGAGLVSLRAAHGEVGASLFEIGAGGIPAGLDLLRHRAAPPPARPSRGC